MLMVLVILKSMCYTIFGIVCRLYILLLHDLVINKRREKR